MAEQQFYRNSNMMLPIFLTVILTQLALTHKVRSQIHANSFYEQIENQHIRPQRHDHMSRLSICFTIQLSAKRIHSETFTSQGKSGLALCMYCLIKGTHVMGLFGGNVNDYCTGSAVQA